MSCNEMLSKKETEWRRNRKNILRRYESSVIRMGSPRREAEIRKAEERGTPMHYKSHPARLETVIDILAHLNGMWQKEWLLAKVLPEYILRDKHALLDMGITLMPRLLGPNQCEEEGRAWWNVAKHDNDDPAQMGRIVAKQMSSGETFIEFWLGDFPDVYMFYEMRQEIEGEIAYTLLSRAKDAQKVSTSDREDMGGGEVTQASTEGDTAEPTPAGNGEDNVKPQPPAIDAPQDDWFSYFDHVTGETSAKPNPPAPDAPNDLWFHWFHYVTDVQVYRMTLRELAREIGLEYGYVRKLHSEYLAQYNTKKEQK